MTKIIHYQSNEIGITFGCLPGIFFQGRGAKSIVMQIYFVMLIFLLFSDQISGGQTASRGAPRPLPS